VAPAPQINLAAATLQNLPEPEEEKGGICGPTVIVLLTMRVIVICKKYEENKEIGTSTQESFLKLY